MPFETPLAEVTFVVLDLETTGGSPEQDRITEIGAVKTTGGEQRVELEALVQPEIPIPPSITALTGIDAGMVAGRPPIEALLPMLLEFCRGAVVVAHNARFDTGFLHAALARAAYPPLDHPVVCTAALARRLVADEVRNCQLATLASHFRASTVPVHRALADARATVDVFHGLLERAGSFGVTTLGDLVQFSRLRNAPVFATRRHLAADLPRAPGVYAFRSGTDEILYVGKATDLRARVRSYFGGDQRRRTPAMLRETQRVDHRVCATPLEAEVRELRLIRAHLPRYNRRHTERRAWWLRLTEERFPRLSITPRAPSGPALGPFPTKTAAQRVVEALQDAAPVRRCTDRIGPRTTFAPCALAEIGRCGAPCDGHLAPEAYADGLAPVSAVFEGDATAALLRLEQRMDAQAAGHRFEDASRVRERIGAVVAATRRLRAQRRLEAARELVAARRLGDDRWEVGRIRAGALASTWAVEEVDQPELADETAWTEDVPPVAVNGDLDAAPPAGLAELELLGRWLDRPGVVVVSCEDGYADAVAGGAILDRHARAMTRSRRHEGRPEHELEAKRLRRAGTLPAARGL